MGIAFEPFDQQARIARFLDRETAKADDLVATYERLIQLLEEKRVALITEAVTKGLDPTVPMKDSGVEWIGEIPLNWQVTPLQRLTPDARRIVYGIVLPGPNVDTGVMIVKGGDVKPNRLRSESLNKTTVEIEARYKRSRLLAGDLVYAIRGGIGDVEIVPREIEGANLTQDAARITPAPGINRRWLRYALMSRPVFCQLEAGSTGAAVKGINIFSLRRAMVPLPPKNERHCIADHLDRVVHAIESSKEKIASAICLIKEHRSALITTAVTGQIDVQTYEGKGIEASA